MRHLKSFKIFESTSDNLLEDIKDIFISLDDFDIKYKIENLEKIGLIHIEILDKSEEINDCLEHLTNYLKDLGHLYFIGKSIKNQTHISIESNFSTDNWFKEIEKDFLRIIEGIREIKRHSMNDESRLWLDFDGNELFVHDVENEYLFYNANKFWRYFKSKYSITIQETNEVVRYLVGKYLKLECFNPFSMG